MRKLYLLSYILLFSKIGLGQISGIVFRDYNNDGVQQNTAPNLEYGVMGAIINAYDSANTLIATAKTDAVGFYTIPFTIPVRLEMETPYLTHSLDPISDFPINMPIGDNVRFIYSTSLNENFAIHNPREYNNLTTNDIFIPRLGKGDPLGLSGFAPSEPLFFGQAYNSSSVSSPTFSVLASETGSVWGVAYSKAARQVFTSAFLKRHAGMGPIGSGGIYKLNPYSGSVLADNFYDLDTAGHRTRAANTAVAYGNGTSYSVNTAGTQATYLGPIDPLTNMPEGLGVIGVNGFTTGGRGLNTTGIAMQNDQAAFGQVGKVSLGDIEISDDDKYLFVVNLYQRNIARLEVNDIFNPTQIISYKEFALPNFAVNNGVLRPFGLGINRGTLYIGCVATAENGGTNNIGGTTDLVGHVFVMRDPTSDTCSIAALPVLSIPFNYPRGICLAAVPSSNQWHPWTDNTLDANLGTSINISHPTPIIGNIGFTENNDMILTILDRTGHQFVSNGWINITATGGNVNNFYQGGDVLIAGLIQTTQQYTLESNGSYNSNGTVNTSSGAANNQGPGNGEYFFEENNYVPNSFEATLGSLAYAKGSKEFITPMRDPLGLATYGSGRFYVNNGTTPSSSKTTMTSGLLYSKTHSLGDIEIANPASTIQIGNKVWNDKNNNGIQDVNELGLPNVNLELFADFNNDSIPDGSSIASTTTNANGNWLFDINNVPDGNPAISGLQPGLAPYKKYLVSVSSNDWAGSIGTNDLLNFKISKKDAAIGNYADVRDNDAFLINGYPTVEVKTGMLGKNDHSYDFGFNSCVQLTDSIFELTCNNTSTAIGLIPEPGNIYNWIPPIGLSNASIANPIASPDSSTNYVLTVNNNSCTYAIKVNVNNVAPTVDSNKKSIIGCEVKTVQLGSAAVPGYTYKWAPPTGLDNDTIAQPMATNTVTTNYTLTVTNTANGCTNLQYTLVEVDLCCTKLLVPNSFSPNGDNVNDVFKIITDKDVPNFNLQIFNRFGQKVFESNSVFNPWDGSYNKVNAELGVYYYILKYNCDNQEKIMLKGDITVIK
jgi:gliding motility-associated-like protein